MPISKNDLINNIFKKAIGHHQLGELKMARLSYEKIIEIDKNNFDAIQLNAAIYLQELDYKNAIALFETALKIDATSADVWNNYGIVLQKLKRFDDALFSFNRALTIDPAYVNAFYNKGDTLQELKQYEESIICYDAVIRLSSGHVSAYNNKGVSLHELERFHEAKESYEKAIAICNTHVDAHLNLGITFERLGRNEDAEISYLEALDISPDSSNIRWNLALIRLRLKKFKSGFDLYRARWGCESFTGKVLKTTIPPWVGTASGESLLLWSEQGIGDEVFFARMLLNEKLKNHKVTLLADKRLRKIFERSFPKINILENPNREKAYESDVFTAQAPIGDLGFFLKISEADIQATAHPYLVPDHNRVEAIRQAHPFFKDSFICGISWRSSNREHGGEKSISLEELLPLINLRNITFLSLQYGDVAKEISDLNKKFGVNILSLDDIDFFDDIEGLLATITLCDVVITTSNVTAHLTGAVGKKGAVFVPHSKGKIWYWHDTEPREIWYPSLRLIHKNSSSNWSDSIQYCKDWLLNFFSERKQPYSDQP
jgi:tetratricopeptide (TPR) repeat protein